MSQIVTVLAGEIRISFFELQKFVILESCDYGNQFYLEKTLKIFQCRPTLRYVCHMYVTMYRHVYVVCALISVNHY